MGSRRRFEWGLAGRTLALAAAILLAAEAVRTPGLAAARLVAVGLALALLFELWRYVDRTNRLLLRFVEAMRFGDHAQRFGGPRGAGFDRLSGALDAALRAQRDSRSAATEEARFLAAVIDDAPVALLAIDERGRVTLLGKRARRLFEGAALAHTDDFAAYGAEFAATMALPAGARRLTRLIVDGVPQHVLVGTARLERLGQRTVIASIVGIQSELGARELATQADLVRVLTHEIMNSLTPVTSLARSTAELVADVRDDRALADAGAAAATVAARAEGILRFVERYRDFAVSPELRRIAFAAQPWAAQVLAIAAADPRRGNAALTVACEPPDARLDGDPDLLAQVALNLIRNAVLAGAGRIELRVATRRGGRAVIEVADDGPGIPADHRDEVFLPFYTTRADGSGVGLSFARQVALAHGGSIVATDSPWGGACIRLAI